METIFREKLKQNRLSQKCNSFCFSPQQYNGPIAKVKRAKQRPNKEPSDYKLIKRFDVLEVAGIEKLISPVEANATVQYFVHDEELFAILSDVHASIGHGGRDRMMKQLKKTYKNITYKDVNIFLSVCKACLQKQKPVAVNKKANSCSQVDLIDLRSHPGDGDHKFAMVYQDLATKFVVLKALRSKRPAEVADRLLDIFTLLGAPKVLQSSSDKLFVHRIIENLKLLWPGLQVQKGQGNVLEHVHEDVEAMLIKWMQDNETSHWAKGLRFVQLMKNKQYHLKINKSPFEALFGQCSLNDV